MYLHVSEQLLLNELNKPTGNGQTSLIAMPVDVSLGAKTSLDICSKITTQTNESNGIILNSISATLHLVLLAQQTSFTRTSLSFVKVTNLYHHYATTQACHLLLHEEQQRIKSNTNSAISSAVSNKILIQSEGGRTRGVASTRLKPGLGRKGLYGYPTTTRSGSPLWRPATLWVLSRPPSLIKSILKRLTTLSTRTMSKRVISGISQH